MRRDGDCDDGVGCTDDTCVAGSCVYTPNDGNCADDGLFCNGNEVCDAVNDCVSTGDPCQPGEFCNETTDTCDESQVDGDCDDGDGGKVSGGASRRSVGACGALDIFGVAVFLLPSAGVIRRGWRYVRC
ncbi:MAG: hypothetical protein ACYSVY_10825 [Planctomycetota bacterium]